MPPEDSTCEERSFKKLYEAHSEALRNFVYYKLGDLEYAEDAVQESFLILWKNCAKVPFEKAKSYLFTVVNNMLLDTVKHQKVVLKYFHQKQVQHVAESPEFILEEQEFRQKLERVLNELPEDQRVVFLMNRVEKMKYREIAELLGISQKTVEKRMHKALLIIKEKIGNI
ncbi:MAG: RNA polymerase sigma-70 factor [Bacteroidota bacterium]